MDASVSRRRFLAQGAGGLSSVWVSAHWPALLAAATHARHAAQSAVAAKFEFFGAHEAGVVYFIDRALTTFGIDDQKTYREGLPELQARVAEMFPGTSRFSALAPEQQDEVLHSFDEQSPHGRQRRFRTSPGAQNFFETLRQHTIAGFLIDPDYGGNRDGAGWKVIGRAREYMFQPPFGYYDKDYSGWQPVAKEAEKK